MASWGVNALLENKLHVCGLGSSYPYCTCTPLNNFLSNQYFKNPKIELYILFILRHFM